MSILRLTEAPLREPMLTTDGLLGKVWLQYVGDFAEATTGYWGKGNGVITYNGVTTSEETKPENTIVAQGQTITTRLLFTGLATVSATFEIPKPYRVLNGVIVLYEIANSEIIANMDIYVEDSQFSLPDMSTSNTVLISGELIRR